MTLSLYYFQSLAELCYFSHETIYIVKGYKEILKPFYLLPLQYYHKVAVLQHL